jgi:uncharacterized membrane protein
MTAVGQILRLRLFLEGVEVPVVAATVQSQKNAPAVASIQIPANDHALNFKPRTLVHLFAYDAYRGAPPEQQVYVGGAGIDPKQNLLQDPLKGSGIPTAEMGPATQSQVDLENANYKLIFGGEVTGIQFSKTPRSRCIILQCVDWSNYWDIAFQYQLSGFNLGGGGIRAAFTGASTTVFNDFLEGSGDIVMKLMSTPPRSYPELKGSLLGAVVHLIEAIGGCYFGERAVKGTNDFFSLAEMRLHLTQMIGANPFSAKDELRLLKANGFGSLFRKVLGGLGKLVSIRQVMLALQRYIFHEVVPVTSPRYIPAAENPNAPQAEIVPIASDRETIPIAKAASAIRTAVLELANRQSKATDVDTAKTQSERRGGLQKEFLQLAATAGSAYAAARKVGVQGGAWTTSTDFVGMHEVSNLMEAASRQLVSVMGATRLGTTGLYQFPVAGTPAAGAITATLNQVADSMQRVLDAKHRRRAARTMSQPDPPQRLITQVYRPDVWMVAPPRCNVFFPELYSQFSYGRNFNAEVSRLLLRTHSAFFGSDILFDGFYMAPSRILGARTGKAIGKGRVGKEPDLSDAPAWVVRDLMDHELFTGIIPAFERMSDLNLHAIRGGSIEINGAKVGYAQLACNHIFFQYRFKSRDLGLSGKFNPYAVLGFPAVVIDKYLSKSELTEATVMEAVSDAFKTTSGQKLPSHELSTVLELDTAGLKGAISEALAANPNTHYLGTPELISHSLDARSGGSTQVQMAYARTTNERTEFLGDNVGTTARAKRTKNVKVMTVVAALEPPKVGSTGFRGGKIVEAPKDVTDRYQKKQPKTKGNNVKGSARFTSNSLLPLFVATSSFAGRRRRGTQVPVGIEQAASAYGPEVVALVGSGGATVAATSAVTVTFRAYQIVEEMGSYVTEDVELPPEELTFPPWYGENYRTAQIGSLYSYFFGVGAITDPTVILGTTGAHRFGEGDDARTLHLQFERNLSATPAPGSVERPDQLPTPGASGSPTMPGGGAAGPAGTSNPETDSVLGKVEHRSTIKLAIDELVRAYSLTRIEHFDTPQFVQNYTWRPIADMVDLFGTSDLNIDDNGFTTAGREGFHSRAFGNYDDLRLLVSGGEGPLPQKILGLTAAPRELNNEEPDKDAKIAARLDTRKEKRGAVYLYLYALSASRGVVLG